MIAKFRTLLNLNPSTHHTKFSLFLNPTLVMAVAQQNPETQSLIFLFHPFTKQQTAKIQTTEKAQKKESLCFSLSTTTHKIKADEITNATQNPNFSTLLLGCHYSQTHA